MNIKLSIISDPSSNLIEEHTFDLNIDSIEEIKEKLNEILKAINNLM